MRQRKIKGGSGKLIRLDLNKVTLTPKLKDLMQEMLQEIANVREVKNLLSGENNS